MISCADLRGDCSVQIVSWLGISWRHGPFVQFQRTIFFFCTSSSKWEVITLVHFGSCFTFFHQLGQMLTRCTLNSFLGKLSLFFHGTLTQTGDSIYFLSGRVYSLGYSLARGLFGKEFHSSSSCTSSLCEVLTSLKPCLMITAVIRRQI